MDAEKIIQDLSRRFAAPLPEFYKRRIVVWIDEDQEFVNYGIDEAFWRMVAQGTGYQEMDSDLAQLATHILLTASTRTMRQEFLAGLQMFISSAHQAYCYDFVSDWMHSDKVNSGEAGREGGLGRDAGDIYAITEHVEGELEAAARRHQPAGDGCTGDRVPLPAESVERI